MKRIYDDKEIQTKIPKKDMKTLLTLCTKNVHFTFNNIVYQQIDGVAMGSPLGPVIAGIFMVDLETKLIPQMSDFLKLWKRYVDDTLCIIKIGTLDLILTQLNNFHENIKFTYEKQSNNMIAFLDVLIVQRGNAIDTAVFRKSTNTDIYINWNSFAPEIWKKSTLKLLVKRAHIICNKDYFLKMELDHLKQTFTEVNNFPEQVVLKIMTQVANEVIERNENEVVPDEVNDELNLQITLPYAGSKGESMAKEMRKFVEKVKTKTKLRIAFKARRLGTHFTIKDRVEMCHQHNIVYKISCPECNVCYIGESGRRLYERLKEHAGRDKNSHVLQHSIETGHARVDINNIEILNKNFTNYYKRKISEALYIKSFKPVLNVQDNSIPLQLFN